MRVMKKLPERAVLIGVASMPVNLTVMSTAIAIGVAWGVADDVIHLAKRVVL